MGKQKGMEFKLGKINENMKDISNRDYSIKVEYILGQMVVNTQDNSKKTKNTGKVDTIGQAANLILENGNMGKCMEMEF